MNRSLEILGELHALAASAKIDFSARHKCYSKPDDLAIVIRLDSAINLIHAVYRELESLHQGCSLGSSTASASKSARELWCKCVTSQTGEETFGA